MDQMKLLDIDIADDHDTGEDDAHVRGQLASRNGIVNELVFEIYCHTHKIEVAKCLNTIARYDYLIKIDNDWRTVQVKSIGTREWIESRKHGDKVRTDRVVRLWRGHISNKNGKSVERRYSLNDFDYLFATTGEEHWLIPHEEIEGRWLVNLDARRYKRFKLEN